MDVVHHTLCADRDTINIISKNISVKRKAIPYSGTSSERPAPNTVYFRGVLLVAVQCCHSEFEQHIIEKTFPCKRKRTGKSSRLSLCWGGVIFHENAEYENRKLSSKSTRIENGVEWFRHLRGYFPIR
jgi:hypothetical protein